MKKVAVLLVALALLAGWAVSSEAMCSKCMGKGEMGMGGMHMGMGMHEDHHMIEIIQALGLTDKVADEVKAVHYRTHKEVIRKKADLGVAETELQEILGKDLVDLKAAEAKVRQIEAVRADIKVLHLKAHEEVKAKLTPEQKKKFQSLIEMKHKGGGMMGGMGMKGKCGMMDDMHGEHHPAAPGPKGPAPAGEHKHH